ncbi:MAG: helix-turn-helix transcriptional regulator [Clostridia bacterium]|nr:helix-turn-helix transcriptional regulator [Clostridia bacterium]
MNNIVYAGTVPHGDQPNTDGYVTNRVLKVFVPKAGGRGGRLYSPTAENGCCNFGSGEIAVVPPGVAHKFADDTDSGITVLIEQPLSPLKEVDILTDAENELIRFAAKQAVDFYEGDSYGKVGVLAALGELIVSYILTFYPEERPSPVVVALREEIDKNLSDSAYSVDIAIRKLPLNYDYVRKLFKKEVGVTPHEYLMRARMKRAKAIMLSGVTNRYSQFTITQIAEACGYAEPLYFSRVFKKYYGVAPSYYIKNV